MRLDEYLKEMGLKPYMFADKWGIKRDSVYNVIRGRGGKLTLETAIKISQATGGKVGIEELLQGSPNWRPTARYKLYRGRSFSSHDVPFTDIVAVVKSKKKKG